MEFKVSVIIPVYNAAPFVRQAVESALAQPETAEVVLVEDNSPDNSLEICQQLALGIRRCCFSATQTEKTAARAFAQSGDF